ncbi:hypothetical protein NA57DRAFT_59484 [Rhizodiscina lignyota]|uniref:Uncharacterized protein n=1 Tax=Rhizodiscina lignyota TaxID=1504668 RepID=A0A9P4I984_9PEZI|nr:hypothetical protein NA57DRAFT_59484 [Rhizodiscina lignyota]
MAIIYTSDINSGRLNSHSAYVMARLGRRGESTLGTQGQGTREFAATVAALRAKAEERRRRRQMHNFTPDDWTHVSWATILQPGPDPHLSLLCGDTHAAERTPLRRWACTLAKCEHCSGKVPEEPLESDPRGEESALRRMSEEDRMEVLRNYGRLSLPFTKVNVEWTARMRLFSPDENIPVLALPPSTYRAFYAWPSSKAIRYADGPFEGLGAPRFQWTAG